MNLRLGPWVSAFRPPAQINLALPMLVGLAQRSPCESRFAGWPLVQVIVVSLLLQAMILYANEASDATTDDPAMRTLISGGAGVGASGALSAIQLRGAAITAGMVGLVFCAATGGMLMAALWLMAVALVWAYDGRMLRLSRHPLGCLCQAFGVGVIVPLLGAGTQAAWPGAAELMIGLSLGLAGHILTALPDEAPDRKVGKITIVVWLGARNAFALMLGALAVAGLLLLGGASTGLCRGIDSSSRASALIFAALASASVGAWILARRRLGEPEAGAQRHKPPGLRSISADLWLAGLVAIVLWLLWVLR